MDEQEEFEFRARMESESAAGPSSMADQIPGNAAIQQAAPENQETIGNRILGALEVPATMATGALGGVVGPVAGIVKGLTGGKYGTAEGVREAGNTAADVAQSMTYQPRTQTGRDLVGGIGRVLDRSGAIAVAPMAGELSTLRRAVAPAVDSAKIVGGAAVDAGIDAAQAGAGRLRGMFSKPAQDMQGMGAATTAESLLRTQRAADLPIPIQLTKGQRDRTFEQQRFERETAKMGKEGEPLRQRFADQNEQVQKNFDAWQEQTGAQSGDLRQIGTTITNALQKKADAFKAKARDAYSAAEQAGEMSELVDAAPLVKFINENVSSKKTAPVIAAVEAELNRLGIKGKPRLNATATAVEPGSVELSINNAEKIRQLIYKNSEPGTPSAAYGKEAIRAIDAATEGKGGPLYQQARRVWENYSKEFADRDVIDKMLRNKPGTRDRAVAYEDVFNHSILKGSLDDVRAVRRSLQTAGDEGQQAWRELQGQTVNHIKDTITANSARDVRGNPIVSPDKLNRLVMTLDADGKLDFVFGKKGAEQIRSVNDLAKDIYTSPPGSVNSSNTATVLAGLLDTAVSGATGIPLPVASGVNYVAKRIKSNALQKQVSAALDPDAHQRQNALSRALNIGR